VTSLTRVVEEQQQSPYGAHPPPNHAHAQGGYDHYSYAQPNPYASAWGNPGPGTHQQYGGYVPPPPSYGHPPQQSRGERMGVQKGRRKMTVPCKFFNHPKGCDRGDACKLLELEWGRRGIAELTLVLRFVSQARSFTIGTREEKESQPHSAFVPSSSRDVPASSNSNSTAVFVRLINRRASREREQ
jgi:hypothetical protein